ncbi:MAG: M43 family zinc metalloprotease [Bacteroidota bacterium]
MRTFTFVFNALSIFASYLSSVNRQVVNTHRKIFGILLPLSIQFIFLPVFSQNITHSHKCGFDHIHEHLLEDDEEYRNTFRINEQLIQRNLFKAASLRSTYTIPVVVHIIQAGSPPGTSENISDQQVIDAIAYTNKLLDADVSEGFSGPSLGIKLQLARRTPDCRPTNGILRWDFSSNEPYVSQGINIENSGGVNELVIKGDTRWPNKDYYNIWIVNRIDGEDGTSGSFTAGYAYFPNASQEVDGTVILASQMTEGNTTLGHEIGHALNLFHTFQGDAANGINNLSCPVNDDCNVDGDKICDTDPHIRSGFTCNRDDVNACSGNPLGQVITNHMDYSSCSENFTQGQKERMITALTTLRPGLIGSLGTLDPPQVPADPICTPVVTNVDNPFGMGPYKVVFNTLDASSGTYTTEGEYVDRVCTQGTTVQPGESYTIEVYTNLNEQKVRVYIDYNNNGDFSDPGELVFSSNEIGTPQIHSGTITIPENPAIIDQAIRLRVVADYITGGEGPCGTLSFGQTEDYSLTISNSAPTPPIITSPTVNTITDVSAVLGANVVGTGGSPLTNRGIVWSLSPNPVVGEPNSNVVSNGDITVGVFSDLVKGLPANTTIYFKGFATNAVGTAYTEEVAFTTGSGPVIATIIKPSVANKSGTTATLGAEITSNGGRDLSEYGIVWSTSPDPAIDDANDTKLIQASEDFVGVFTLAATSLPSGDTVYFKGYAINEIGTAYTNDTFFLISSEVSIPFLNTLTYSIQSGNSVITEANLVNDGGATISEKGFVWDTLANPTIGGQALGQAPVSGTDIGTFSTTLSQLPTDKMIFLRGYATNSVGTGYTGDTTLMIPSANVQETLITEFTATAQTNGVLLSWSAIEVGNQQFVIERSLDESIWQVQTEIEGAGTSLSPTTYTNLDLPPRIGTIYYRIRYVVAGGVSKYSEVRSVNFDPGSSVTAFPLPPVDGSLTISIPYLFNSNVQLQIVDPLGRIMYENTYLNQVGREVEEVINVNGLQNGLYYLSVKDGEYVSMKRIIIYSAEN